MHADDVSAPVDFDPSYFESYVTLPPRSPTQPPTTYLQEGGLAAADVGVQAPARDRPPHAALSW